MGTIRRVCLICKTVYGEIEDKNTKGTQDSHGYCQDCTNELWAKEFPGEKPPKVT